jgi:hypothetical protein
MPRTRTSWTQRPAGAGKPKGTLSHKRREVKEFFEKFFDSKEYQDNLKSRILRGKAQAIETLGYYYVCGKPKERVQIDDPHGLLSNHDAIAEAIIVRITSLATARSAQAGNPTDVTPGATGTVLLVEGTGQAEPITTGGDVDDVAVTVREGVRENEDRSRNDQDMGGPGV